MFKAKNAIKQNRLQMKCYFIHMSTVAGLTDSHSIEPIFVHFFVYGVVSRQWHHESWPYVAQITLVCRYNSYLWQRPTEISPIVLNGSFLAAN